MSTTGTTMMEKSMTFSSITRTDMRIIQDLVEPKPIVELHTI